MSARPGHLTLVRPLPELPDPLRATHSLPDAPPAEVLAEVAGAAGRVDELAANDRLLHFETGPDGQVVVELRTLSGTVVRRITGADALAVMAGLVEVD